VARLAGTGGTPSLLFAGHVDVVPLGKAEWSFEPFAGEIANGKLLGRGSSDMKGGVAAFVRAGLELAGAKRGSCDIVFVIAAGEETGCEGSLHVAASGSLGATGAIVIAEPTSNRPLLGHRGALWLKGTARGRTAHGSMPEHGDNAVYKAARAVLQLPEINLGDDAHPLLGRTTLNVGTFHAGLNLNSVPDLAEFTIDIRSLPDADHQRLIDRVQAAVGRDVVLERVMDLPGVMTEADHPWIEGVFGIAARFLGSSPKLAGAPYFTDASALTPACGHPPTIILGPGEMALAHQTDEYCYVEKIEEAVAIYVAIARDWLETKES
jgi:succinyl-diaminopimelate desuccinylase